MKTDVVIDTREVDRLFSRLGKQTSKAIAKALAAVSERGIQVILDRTAKGKGINVPFRSYTPAYKLFRQEKGRGIRPNLNFSGRMLGSMTSKVDRPNLTADIYFSRANEALKAMGNNQSRPFFGFNTREKNYLRRWFYKYLEIK